MRKLLLLPLALSAALNVFSQNGPDHYLDLIDTAGLRNHLSIIAGPQMEGRETGTEGQRRAAAYIESQFQVLGLKPGNKDSYQQEFFLLVDSITKMEIRIGKQRFMLDKDFNGNVRFNKSATIKASKLVFAGYGISDSS